MKRTRYKVTSLSDRHAFIRITDRVAVIVQALKRSGKGGRRARLVSAYAGFDTQSAAIAFVAGVKRYFSKAYCQVRKAERLACQWEVKVRYFNENALETFIWSFAENPAIVATAEMTPQQAKASIMPIEPITPMQPVSPIALAPVQLRSYRSKTVGGLAIE